MSETMQGLLLNQTLSYQTQLPKPQLGANEALIAMKWAGICATDLELVKGYAGFKGIPGHEFVGVVCEVNNPEHRHWLNQRVVGSINIGCGQCPACQQKLGGHCQQRSVLGIRNKAGVFADYFSLPVQNLYRVPENVPDQAAVLCEPLAAALQVKQQLAGLAIQQVAVIGPGRLGLLIGRVLALAGFQVQMLGRSETSLALARQWQLASQLIHTLAANSYDCVVDASGQAEGFAQALRIIRPQGQLILKSTFAASSPIDLSPLVIKEIQLQGSRCGPFEQALQLLTQHQLDYQSLIDGHYSLAQGLAAFEHASQAGIRKILLSP